MSAHFSVKWLVMRWSEMLSFSEKSWFLYYFWSQHFSKCRISFSICPEWMAWMVCEQHDIFVNLVSIEVFSCVLSWTFVILFFAETKNKVSVKIQTKRWIFSCSISCFCLWWFCCTKYCSQVTTLHTEKFWESLPFLKSLLQNN